MELFASAFCLTGLWMRLYNNFLARCSLIILKITEKFRIMMQYLDWDAVYEVLPRVSYEKQIAIVP